MSLLLRLDLVRLLYVSVVNHVHEAGLGEAAICLCC